MKLTHALRSASVLVTAAVLTTTALPAQAATYDDPVQGLVPNGRVYAIATDATRVYIGGTFTRLTDPSTGKSVDRSRLAAFDADTGKLDTTWNPGADNTVRALAVEGGVVYAGGLFANAGGAANTKVAALDTGSGRAIYGFDAAASGEVRDLSVVGNDLYVAGSFTSVNGRARVGVAKVNAATGALDTGWNARVGLGRVVALAEDPQRNQLVIGGNFKTLAGAAVSYLGAVSYATGARNADWTPLRVCDTCNVLDVDVAGANVFAATAGGGGGRAVAYKLTGNARLWIKQGDGDVQAVDYYDGGVYVGGHFTAGFDGVVRHQVAELDPTTGAVQELDIPFTGLDDPGVWAVKADSSALRIGGGFQGISGISAARYAVLPAVP
jgi:hypothetical protein